MVLVFSSRSNRSEQVLREVERAVSKKVPIIPFRIENIMPSEEFEYFISSAHWLDAYSPPIERHIETLIRSVESAIGKKEESEKLSDGAKKPLQMPKRPQMDLPTLKDKSYPKGSQLKGETERDQKTSLPSAPPPTRNAEYIPPDGKQRLRPSNHNKLGP